MLAPLACSSQHDLSTAKIFGGTAVMQGEFAAVVALTRQTNSSTWQLICSGVLISPRHVLTAGHCIAKATAEPEKWRLYTGTDATNGRVPSGNHAYLHSISKMAVPTYFHAHPSGEGDIGLVTLDDDIEHIAPAALMPSQTSEFAALAPGQSLMLVGFGTTETGLLGRKLMTETQASWFNAHEAFVGGSGRDGCHGDSGGGAFAISKASSSSQDHKLRLLGLISRSTSPGCGQGGLISLVAEHRCWLQDTTELDFDCQRLPPVIDRVYTQTFLKQCQNHTLGTDATETMRSFLDRLGTDDCQQATQRLSTRTSLNLDHLRLVDLAPLSRQKQIQELSLVGNHLTNIAPLLTLPRLKKVWLRGNDIPRAALRTLSQRGVQVFGKHLQVTAYPNTSFARRCQEAATRYDSDVVAIFYATQAESCEEANLKLLASRSLSLAGLGVTQVNALANLETLEQLDLSDNPLTDISPLRHLENLRQLDLTKTAVQDIRRLKPLLDAGLNIVGGP